MYWLTVYDKNMMMIVLTEKFCCKKGHLCNAGMEWDNIMADKLMCINIDYTHNTPSLFCN